MDVQLELLPFLDLLDLDEEIIDSRLKLIMQKSNHTNKNLINAIQLLQYKNLINTQEDSDCDNEEAFNFAVKLLRNVNRENVDYVCKVIYIVLCLNKTNIVNKSEHLIQQILFDIDFNVVNSDINSIEGHSLSKIILNLKLCNSILDAIQKKNEKLSLHFLETPLEKILDFVDEKLKAYFLTNLVPKLFNNVMGYNIFDRIWNYLKQLEGEHKQNALKVLGCLSDYYLPMSDINEKIVCESEIIFLHEFWDLVLFGLMYDDSSVRKISVYLLKRAIDCVISSNKDIYVQQETHIAFQWRKSLSKHYKIMWDNYFILIDSLEEKQSNIVLPSLKLFETINIGECWLNAAFNIGLKHESNQVRLKCVKYRLKYKVRNQYDAIILLEVFNNINIYDHNTNFEMLKNEMKKLLCDRATFAEILKAIHIIKWSPVPFYYITDILANLGFEIQENFADKVLDITKVSCTSVVIRKAAYYNIANFIRNCIPNINWKDMINIHYAMQLKSHTGNPLNAIITQLIIQEKESYEFFNFLSKNILNIELILLYLSKNEYHLNTFMDIVNKKLSHINEVVNRQYSNKNECLDDVIFLINLLSQIECSTDVSINNLHILIIRQIKTLVIYVLSLFSSDTKLSIENCVNLFETHGYEFKDNDLEDYLLQLYKTSILFLKDVPELDKALLSIFSIKMLQQNSMLINKYCHEMVDLKQFLDTISNFKFRDSQNQSVGRWKNMFYEKSCEIIDLLIKDENDTKGCLIPLINYIENVLECGGYGCLKWILKIINKIVNMIVGNDTKFNMTQFINKVWNEIEELKSNNQYSPCIEEFVELINQDALLKEATYNNIVISYCNKIIEYGPIKSNPLFYLIRKINKRCITEYGHLVYILCEILMYSPVIRKDERITNNVSLQILQDSTYGIDKSSVDIHFNFEIQYLSIHTLCSINDREIINTITKFMVNRIDENFHNKQRYHGNSQPHKVLQLTLQHILMISLKSSENLDWLLNWSLEFLVKLPHQPSVRICLEWIVALYFYVKKTTLNDDILQILKTKNAPLTSQFSILYWLLKHKIINKTFTEDEYDFVLDFLLSHTMGQLFNVRLYAQYLSKMLHQLANKSTKFDYTIAVIEKTLKDNNTDKTFTKLKKDYFFDQFDIIANLNPYFIYYLLPKLCESDGYETVDTEFVSRILKDVSENIIVDDNFKDEWTANIEDMKGIIICESPESEGGLKEDVHTMGTIQKKYIPWKNMSDINVYDVEKKILPTSDLIVVASLIDKLPNLGGMARTSEVFGVKTYVVDSLRHLQDKQFQGLSVSAERWINIEEVRPGNALKEYLLQKKCEGYSVVAAEQTSTSSKLQTFKFPKKTLLLLGHEKEGVPCDLLPIMDHCVEIPQQGYVRSLNVHVTAAIFVWEYARQNIL